MLTKKDRDALLFIERKKIYIKYTEGVFVDKGMENKVHLDKFIDVLNADNSICEIIEWDGSHGNRLYIDIDMDTFDNMKDLMIEHHKVAKRLMKDGFNLLGRHRKLPNGKCKLSLHGVHKTLGSGDNKIMKRYVKDKYGKLCDDKVYGGYQKFLCIGQSKRLIKMGDTYKFRIIGGCSVKWMDYVIGCGYSEEIELYEKSVGDENEIDEDDKKFKRFIELVMILDEYYYTNYDAWIKVMFGIKNSGYDEDDSLELFMTFSKQLNEYNERETYKKWYSCKVMENGIDEDTIIEWCKSCNMKRYEEIIRKYEGDCKKIHPKIEMMCSIEEYSFCLQDLRRKWNTKLVDTNKKINEFLVDVQRCIGIYDNGDTRCIIKNKTEVHECGSLSKALKGRFIIIEKRDKRNGKLIKREMSMYEFIVKKNLNLLDYDGVVFEPFNPRDRDKGLTPDIYNYFNGFKCCWGADDYDNIHMDKIKIVLNHILEVVANNDLKIYRFILMWLANIIQKPWKKTGIIIVVTSKQGVGKNILTDLFIEHLFGSAISTTIDDLEKITTRFNVIVEKKIFIVLDEAIVVNKMGNYHKVFNILKSKISGKTQIIEKKFIDSYVIDDCCNYVLFSNYENIVKVETTDRRYVVLEASDKYKGNSDYFIKFVKDCYRKDCMFEFVKYLMSLDIENYNLESNMPMTDLKKNLMYKSIGIKEKFVLTLLKNYNDDDRIENGILYERYEEFYKRRTGKICREFKDEFLRYVSKKIGLDSYMSHGKRGKIINKKIIRKSLEERYCIDVDYVTNM